MKRRLFAEERSILLAGLLGLSALAFAACGGDDDAADGSNAGAAGTTNDDGGGATPSGSAGAPASASCGADPRTAENTAAVAAAASDLLGALTDDQRAAIAYELTLVSAQQWSNFPTTFVARNGVRIGDMSQAAQSAAVKLAEVAAGSTGSELLNELREADEFLVTDGNASSTDYGRGLFYFSIHGAPSEDSAWMLQIAGHHLAYNFMYNGKCTSATPLFDGVEPTSFTDSDGKEHAPLETQRAAVVELLTSIAELDGAKLSGTFSDLVNGPSGGGPGAGGPGGGMPGAAAPSESGGGDTKYPASLSYPTGTSGRGVSVASLSATQVAQVKTAIEAWVDNAADPVAAALLDEYESDEALANTYVGYAGDADLSTQNSYFRVDGPRVWIELTVQGGIVYHDRVHYHTIWRDKVADYGAEFASP